MDNPCCSSQTKGNIVDKGKQIRTRAPNKTGYEQSLLTAIVDTRVGIIEAKGRDTSKCKERDLE